jgi:SOS-response transcriptional repressor LexA
MDFTFKSKLWRWQGNAPAAWHFITLPEEIGAQIKFMIGKAKGFGSVRVKAVIGESNWKTSLFPDKKSGSFLLPVKAEVRKAAGIADGDIILVRLNVDV